MAQSSCAVKPLRRATRVAFGRGSCHPAAPELLQRLQTCMPAHRGTRQVQAATGVQPLRFLHKPYMPLARPVCMVCPRGAFPSSAGLSIIEGNVPFRTYVPMATSPCMVLFDKEEHHRQSRSSSGATGSFRGETTSPAPSCGVSRLAPASDGHVAVLASPRMRETDIRCASAAIYCAKPPGGPLRHPA